MLPYLVEQFKIVKCYQGAADSVACDVVCMKNVIKGWFVVIHTGSADTDLTLSLYEATTVAAGTNAAVSTACPIWADTDMGTSSDTLVAQTADYDWTIDTGDYPNQMMVIEWDPTKHTAGYDCIYLSDSGGNASNTVTILFIGLMKHQGASLDTVITD